MASTPRDVSDDTFLKVDEVATKLRVSKMTVYRAIHSGVLRSIQVGRSYRIPMSAYKAYVKSIVRTAVRPEIGE